MDHLWHGINLSATQQVLLYGGAAGATDPAFSTVVQLAHFDGSNGSTTFTNNASHGGTINNGGGSDVISTSQSVFGGASLRRSSSGVSAVDSTANTDYQFGTNDFTIEFRFRQDALQNANIFEMRPNGVGSTACACIYALADGTLGYWLFNAVAMSSTTGLIAATTWYGIALSRVSGTTRLFLDGTQVASFSDSANYNATTWMWMGSWATGAVSANYDELRVSNGAFGAGAGRYSSGYTLATAAFPDS